MLSRFYLIPERHGQTDRQTELLYEYRASVCWRAIKIGVKWSHRCRRRVIHGRRLLPLCPDPNYKLRQRNTLIFNIQLHFGFRFHKFQHGSYISIPDWTRIYLDDFWNNLRYQHAPHTGDLWRRPSYLSQAVRLHLRSTWGLIWPAHIVVGTTSSCSCLLRTQLIVRCR